MEQTFAWSTKALSDSELIDRNSEQIKSECLRTKRNSGSHLFPSNTIWNSEQFVAMGTNNNLKKEVIDHGLFNDAVSSLNCSTVPSRQTEDLVNLTVESANLSKISGLHEPKITGLHEQEISSLHEPDISLERKATLQEDEILEREYITDYTLCSESCSLQNATESSSLGKNSKHHETASLKCSSSQLASDNLLHQENKTLSIVADNNDQAESTRKNLLTENSSPYRNLKDVSTNASTLGENFIGEPRCLTLKKHITDDDDMDDALELDFSEFDEEDELIADQQKNSEKNDGKTLPNPNDMFLDDDPNEAREVKKIQYINLTSPRRNWECPFIEKEEGELTPDLYSSTHSDAGESKRSNVKKPERKESNQDFFLKINRCFRQLEREFSNMHVPRGSRRMIGQLQNTLCNVDRMKRKLSLLIDSAKNSGDKAKNVSDSKTKSLGKNQYTESKNNQNPASGSERNSTSKSKYQISNSSESNTIPKGSQQDWKTAMISGSIHLDDYRNGQLNKGCEERKKTERNSIKSMLHDSIRSQKKTEAKIDRHIHRTAASITHAGTRQERQRIQSLFKRQMSLINQHVIQKNDGNRTQNLKYGGSRTVKDSEQVQKSPQITSLDDMEAFLEGLKARKGQSTASVGYLTNENDKNHGVLRFTTKKGKNTLERRMQPVLLTGLQPPENSILPQTTPTSKQNETILSASSTTGGIRNEEQEKVLKIMYEVKKQAEMTLLKNKKEMEAIKLLNEQMQKSNLNNPPNADELSKLNLAKDRNLREQRYTKSVMKTRRRDDKEFPVEEIEFQNDEEASSKRVIDSFSAEINSKEMECIKPPFHSKSSDLRAESREINPENPKKRKRRTEEEYSSSKSSESDSDPQSELKDQILKKRKRNENEGSCGKLSSTERKKDMAFERKSRTRHRSVAENIIDDFDEKLPEELRGKKLFIVGDKNLALVDEHFYLKVKGNQIFLKKVGKIKGTESKRREQRNLRIRSKGSSQSDMKIPRDRERDKMIDEDRHSDSENMGPTLKEMEDFLQQLRAKKKISSEEKHNLPQPSHQTREMKFMARIQAKRKAKLMACVSETPNITEKEAKFLKDLENRARDPSDSPDTEKRKQKLMQKIQQETDAIILDQKPSSKHASNPDDDPLSDVKTFLNMIKEAESSNDENSKQFYVSFSLKRSDVKQLENITTGRASALTEESQRFLNSVRAKMRAKKAPILDVKDVSDQKD